MDSNIVWHTHEVDRSFREQQQGHRSCVLWFTGLSGSGKSTIANEVEKQIAYAGNRTYTLDGDNVRHGLNKGLTFSDEDRIENIRRVSEVAKLMCDAGCIVFTAFISPFNEEREKAKQLLGDDYIEVFIDTPLEVCESRDPKGLYKKARSGEIKNFTGISSDFEAPENAQIHIKTDGKSVSECAELVINHLRNNQILK